MIFRSTIFLAAAAVTAAGCGKERTCNVTSPVSYATHIEPLMTAHCTECHASNKFGSERKQAPERVNYDSYDDTKRNATRGDTRIFGGTMPLTYELEDGDACNFRAWVQTGMAP